MSNVNPTRDITLKHVALFTAVALATIGVVLLLWQFSSLVALVLVSLAVAAMTRAPVDWLVRRRVPQGIALLIIYVIGICVLLAIAWFVLPRLIVEVQTLFQNLSTVYTDFQARWMTGSRIQQGVMRRLPSAAQLNELLLGGSAGMTALALSATLSTFDFVAQSLLVVFISLYWSSDKQRFERLFLSFISATHRARARTAWREIDRGLGAYLRSETVQCLLAGMLLTVGFVLLGMPYPFICAVFAALAWLLPLVGGLVAVIPIFLIGMLTSPTVAFFAVLYTFVVFAFLEFIVERKLYPRERYGSVMVLLITIIMVEALGISGLLIAPPLAAAIQIALTEWLRPTPIVAEVALPDVSLASLKSRLHDAQMQLSQLDQSSPRTQNLMARLSALIAKAEDGNFLTLGSK